VTVAAESKLVHTVIVDWDGTAVPAMWPERPTTFMPRFVENMRRMHRAGLTLMISSARTNPHDPWTGQCVDPIEVQAEVQYIRDTLDNAGLTFIDIWTKRGKPSGSVYIDDKAERYNQCDKCWDKVTTRVLMRLGKEEPVFPAFRTGGTN
jgi:hypothetical protein